MHTGTRQLSFNFTINLSAVKPFVAKEDILAQIFQCISHYDTVNEDASSCNCTVIIALSDCCQINTYHIHDSHDQLSVFAVFQHVNI
jgi:hypothetical protein